MALALEEIYRVDNPRHRVTCSFHLVLLVDKLGHDISASHQTRLYNLMSLRTYETKLLYLDSPLFHIY
jgi:hypothetical protein